MSNYVFSTMIPSISIDEAIRPVKHPGKTAMGDIELNIDSNACIDTILALCIDVILGKQGDALNLTLDNDEKLKKIHQLAFLLNPCLGETNECSLNWTKLLRETRKLAREPPLKSYASIYLLTAKDCCNLPNNELCLA